MNERRPGLQDVCVLKPHIGVAHLTPLFFAPRSYVGGGERYVANLARALRAAGPCLDTRFTQAVFACGERDETFVEDGLVIRVLANDNARGGGMDAIAEPLWRELEGFDLVHVHQSLTVFGAYGTAVAKSLGKRAVLTDLGGGAHRLMLEARGMELADGVLSISDYARSLVAASYSGPHEVLAGPVDTDRFSPAGARGRPVRRVLCVSRIMPHKGIDRIIAALPAALALTVAGQPYHEPYLDMLRGMSAGKDVTFVHDADDAKLLALYRSADLFAQGSTVRDCYGALVSKPELMGLTTLEAMSCGLPAVVSDAGSLPELVPDDRFGRVFGTHEQLAGIFDDVLAGLWPPPGAGGLARRHVVERYGLAAVGERLGRFYARVCTDRCAS